MEQIQVGALFVIVKLCKGSFSYNSDSQIDKADGE